MDDDEDYEYIDAIDQDTDDLEDMIFMWNTWRSGDLSGACWRNGYSRGLAVGGVFPGCGFGFYGYGPMCYANACPLGYMACGGLCSPISVPCGSGSKLNKVEGMIGDCIENEVAGNAGVFFPGVWSSCSRSDNPLGFCPRTGKQATQFGTASAKGQIAAAQMASAGKTFLDSNSGEYLLLEQGGPQFGQGPQFQQGSLNRGAPGM